MEGTQTGRIRASDAEREQTAEIVRAAMGEGRLALDEGETRLTAVYAAVHRDELAPLTADLPGRGLPGLARTPERRAAARRHLRTHASVVLLVSGVLIAIWAATGAHFFWPVFAIVPMLLSVFKHAAIIRAGGTWAGRDWHGHGPWGHGHPRDRFHAYHH
ncbi:DUF1707 SHOCT-like domain-containing protein [Catenuloplanes atrovinosus]|uniref:DUF1707 domain-containing protein n=1 Tax=Catenuloplanes atrovinosus TaxID=137266 RepID=A0AAE3YRG8_9ACTN|nr:DUF1707 domain-containing protein [Catenuloplanes atrovinosus]MDR7277882.1 hypothetical protein [Catenuloplanes atrovinosus]